MNAGSTGGRGRRGAEPRLARLARAIADPARSRMLAYLMDGHYASAGELARAASVAASTTSGHLAQLCEAGLLTAETRGRHRYFKLADGEVAHALEALALVAERGEHQRAWNSPQRAPMRYARCCYGHLAGTLGVMLLDAMLRKGCLQPCEQGGLELQLTDAGAAWLHELGLPWRTQPGPASARASTHRSMREAYACLDWSERRDHLAGTLATQLLRHFITSGWLRQDGTGGHARALTLTPTGHTRLLPAISA